MKNFKKDVQDFLDKNNIRYKEGTIGRLRQDFLAYREKKRLELEKERLKDPPKKHIQHGLF